jgi:LPS export ABC transporter permease LptF/LPS export ABC transporter permease LptG
MRIIDRYVVRQVFSHALLGLAVFTFVFFVPQLVRLMELIVRHSGSGSIALLFLSTLPGVFTFTFPMAVLVGILIGLGRMSADSELIALNAVGIGLRRILVPVGLLAAGGTVLTLAMTLWLGPISLRFFRQTEGRILASQASFQVQPRVFDETFPKLVLYVHDVEASGAHWHGVFLAETGSDVESRMTVAEDALVIPGPQSGRVQFHFRGGSTHEYSRREPDRYSVTTFGESDWPVDVSGFSVTAARRPTLQERSLGELQQAAGIPWREAHVELHRRLAFPAACLVFALIAVPLGARPRRGGRAAGFLIALVLIAAYYLVFIIGAGLARQGAVSPAQGMWAANVVLGLFGLALLPGMERLHEENWFSRLVDTLTAWLRRRRAPPAESEALRAPLSGALNGGNGLNGPVRARTRASAPGLRQSAGFPQLMDLYVLRNFMYYFILLLAAFIFLFEAFTFFELLDDIARHRTPFLVVVDYFEYLTPYLCYQIAPLAALVGVLVTLGVMTKNNEIVAFKASGVSLYRTAVPLLGAGLCLAGAMLVLDETFLPFAVQRQDELRNQIKGRPPRTFYQPRHQWIFGENSKIYNYDFFDSDRHLFGGLNVFELDGGTFQIKRRVFATRAFWEQNAWILESGWARDFDANGVVSYTPFQVTKLAELTEPPTYFTREVRQASQMNWQELRGYINDLHQAGFDVATLTVQWHKKLAFPFITPIIMLLAIPFALLVGTRGAVGGVALGVGIGIVYWATAALVEAIGGIGGLPPLLAGWSPDFIFSFLGLYFFLKMPT